MTGHDDNGKRITIGNLALVAFVNTMMQRTRWMPVDSKGVWVRSYKATANMIDEMAVYR